MIVTCSGWQLQSENRWCSLLPFFLKWPKTNQLNVLFRVSSYSLWSVVSKSPLILKIRPPPHKNKKHFFKHCKTPKPWCMCSRFKRTAQNCTLYKTNTTAKNFKTLQIHVEIDKPTIRASYDPFSSCNLCRSASMQSSNNNNEESTGGNPTRNGQLVRSNGVL